MFLLFSCLKKRKALLFVVLIVVFIETTKNVYWDNQYLVTLQILTLTGLITSSVALKVSLLGSCQIFKALEVNSKLFSQKVSSWMADRVLNTYLQSTWLQVIFFKQAMLIFFSICFFFDGHSQFIGQQKKGGKHHHNYSDIYCSFTTEMIRCIFHQSAFIYQTINHNRIIPLLELAFD